MKRRGRAKTSQHKAALTLSEEGKDPYATIFFTAVSGSIAFTALLVAGTQDPEDLTKDALEQGQRTLVYKNGDAPHEQTTNPDEVRRPLVVGLLEANGAMSLTRQIRVESEDEALCLISVLRALYQMQGQIAEVDA